MAIDRVRIDGNSGAPVVLLARLTVVRATDELRVGLFEGLTAIGATMVGPDEVPLPDPARTKRLVASCEAELTEALDAVGEATHAFDATMVAERVALDDVKAARAASVQATERATARRSLLAETGQRRDVIATQIDQARTKLSGLELQVQTLVSASKLIDAESARVSPRRRTDDTSRLAKIATAAREADFDTYADRLEAWIAAIEDGSADTHPRALELLERHELIERRWAQAGRGRIEDSAEIAAARSRLDQLTALIGQLESQLATGGIGAVARQRIETAHADLLKADEGGRRAARSADEAREVEGQLLTQNGFDSYTDFMIASSTLGFGQHTRQKLQASRADLAKCVSELKRAVTATETAVAAVHVERCELLDHARSLIGGDDAASEDAGDSTLEWDNAMEALRSILAVPGILDELLVAVSSRCNTVQDAVDAQLLKIVGHESELDELVAAMATINRATIDDDVVAFAAIEEAAINKHALAVEARDTAARVVADAKTARAMAAARVNDARRTRYDSLDVDDARRVLGDRCASIRADSTGGVTILMCGGLNWMDARDLIATLDELAVPDTQIVYFSDQPSVWALAKSRHCLAHVRQRRSLANVRRRHSKR